MLQWSCIESYTTYALKVTTKELFRRFYTILWEGTTIEVAKNEKSMVVVVWNTTTTTIYRSWIFIWIRWQSFEISMFHTHYICYDCNSLDLHLRQILFKFPLLQKNKDSGWSFHLLLLYQCSKYTN